MTEANAKLTILLKDQRFFADEMPYAKRTLIPDITTTGHVLLFLFEISPLFILDTFVCLTYVQLNKQRPVLD